LLKNSKKISTICNKYGEDRPSKTMTRIITTALMSLLLLLSSSLPAQQLVVGEHVDAQLIAEMTGVAPGQDTWVALRLDHMEGWHTYWKNPGDAGRATMIDWTLPEGVTAGEIVWPTPKRIELPADLVDFGYEDEIFLLTQISVPATYQGSSVDISANAQWLECEEICIPGGAIVDLSLPVMDAGQISPDPNWAEGFAQTRAALPTSDVSFDASFTISDGSLNILVQATEAVFENARSIRFIPGEHRVFDYISPQEIDYQLSSLQLSQGHHPRLSEAPEEITGLLLVTENNGQQIAYEIAAAPNGLNPADFGVLAANAGTANNPAMGSDTSLLLVFGFALLGGMILNLMPCVFPVLSLKVLSISSNRNASQHEKRLHGLAYTAGIVLAFLILASVLLALQAGGSLIGWGFHLQSPWFVSLLIFLFFLMGLSMSGVVEFGTSVMGMGSDLQDKDGYSGSFFTGVLASVVASPCTAPFMGAALGFAFTQPPVTALAVFVALGLGMALPFLLISFNPALSRLLPHPGKWMLTFKQVLAFPLYATAVWLLWVLGNQAGPNAMALVVGSCVLLAFAAWLYQRRRQVQSPLWRYANALLIILCIVATIGVIRSPFLETSTTSRQLASENANFESYSDARLAELRQGGQPVFVNMTASWCITCLVNERVALSSEAFDQALQENNVAYLKGDWTNNDPEITAVLQRYETSGVPLYLMYPADPDAPAEVLPQILTTGMVLDAIERI
tara:strand:- start:157631 stop:159841 length:2211 start_codon:yes stop_codon:yes gene_type:complete